MSERRWHAVTGTSGFKPGIWRWQRGEVLVMLASLGFGLGVFHLLKSVMDLPNWMSLSMAFLIPGIVAVFLLCLVTGKPAGHAADWAAWTRMRLTDWLVSQGVPMKSKPLIEIPEHERNKF